MSWISMLQFVRHSRPKYLLSGSKSHSKLCHLVPPYVNPFQKAQILSVTNFLVTHQTRQTNKQTERNMISLAEYSVFNSDSHLHTTVKSNRFYQRHVFELLVCVTCVFIVGDLCQEKREPTVRFACHVLSSVHTRDLIVGYIVC